MVQAPEAVQRTAWRLQANTVITRDSQFRCSTCHANGPELFAKP